NKHEYSLISDEDFLASKMFYTLNTDYRGNLLIGTNKGIILLTVNENGQPTSGELYNSENGFDGYETNMRVQFQENFDSFLVGTIEGLYHVRPNLLYYHKKLRKPLVRYYNNNGEIHLNQTDSLFQIQKGITTLKIDFGIVNNDENKTQYTYRIKGYTEKWSVLSKKRSVEYKNLPEGNYIFQVRATNNLKDYSATSEFNFMIRTPFYKKQIFVFFIIILLVFINLLILNRTKKLSAENVIISKKSEMKKTVAFSILMFGGLANTAAHLIAPLIDDTLINNLTFSISLGLIVVTIALILQFKEGIFRSPKRIVFICFVLLTIFNFYGLITSKIHPYYVCSLLISLMLLPFIIHRSKNILLFGAVITTIGLIITFFLKDTFYDKTLFIVSIGIASSVTVFSTFLRNNSYKKLLFTSNIINQGNVLVIAFKKDGTITFMSENFEALFDFKISKFIGKPISTLNQYQPELLLDTFRSINIKEEFEEDKIFTSPLTLQNSDVKYYQWSCKEFKNESRVILGQDITEKISLEKYYELLIHNSDDLIYQTDVDAKFVYLNEKCKEITGYSNNELLGSDIMQLIEPSHITRTLKFYGHQFNQRIKTTYYEFPIKTKKGEIKWLGQNVTTLFKDGSNHLINGYLASVKDITDKKNSVEVIADQNEQIKTSTTNAKHVQLNILPTKDKFDKNFHSSFVFSQPKDVVSGDFYWLEKVGDKKILVTADCNGHGVPGSIMTLLGINLINEIVLQEKISDPGKILTELHKKILKILPRESSEKINDKIKCSICLFSDKSKDIQFASANAKMALIKDGKAITLEGNKESIGAKTPEDFIFKTMAVELNKEDSLYMFSDGFEQQLNVQTNQKVGENNFFKILIELEKQKNENAKDFISKTLEEHIGTGTQSDDITNIKIKH
ncbi:MAG: PAS domain S-box protein, partial [Lishizhenia sp.]